MGEAWTMLDAVRGSKSATLIVIRLLVGHSHISTFLYKRKWETNKWIICHWCGDDVTRNHLIWSCSVLPEERLVFLREVGSDRVGDFE